MNEEYLKQIQDLISNGLTEEDAFVQIVSSEGFMGDMNEIIGSLSSKKKDPTTEIEEADSGSEGQDTQQGQPTTSGLDPEGSDFSLQENQLELVNKAGSEIGDDYSFWLKNALGKEDKLEFYDPEAGKSKIQDFQDTWYGKIAMNLSPIGSLYAGAESYGDAQDLLFQKDGQEIRNDMPVPPENTPAYKQWYNSLPPSAQSDVAAPKDYLEYTFTAEQEKLADNAYDEISKKFYQIDGLKEGLLSYKTTSRNELQEKLDAGEIDKTQFAEESDKINNEYLQDVYQTFMEKEGGGIVKNYIGLSGEEQDTDFAEAFSDKLFYEYGVDSDLDGDGMYNSQNIFMSLLESADAEIYRMGTGLESLAEQAMDMGLESIGSDYADEEYFKNQRAYLNKRYAAENADVTLVTKSMTEAFSDGDLTAGFTHVGNAVGTMLPLIAMTAAEALLAAPTGGATAVAAGAQWTAFAARFGMTAARLGKTGARAAKLTERTTKALRLNKAGSRVAKLGDVDSIALNVKKADRLDDARRVSTSGEAAKLVDPVAQGVAKTAGSKLSEVFIKGGVGQMIYGVASGSATYTSIADDPKWGNGALGTADKIVYSIVTGAGDYALTRLGMHGFRTAAAAKNIEKAYRRSKILAKNSGDLITRQMVKSFAMKRGLNLGGEALSEAVTNTAQYIIEADSKIGMDISLEEAMTQAIDGALTGIAVGAAFDVSGSLFGRATAAARGGSLYDVNIQQSTAVLREDLKSLKARLENTSNPSQIAEIKQRMVETAGAIAGIEAEGQSFYDMLLVRQPEALEALNKKDIEIAKIAAELKATKKGSSQETILRGQLKVLVDERLQIEAEHRTEDGDYRLTAEEKAVLTDMKIEERITREVDELNLQQMAAKEREEAGDNMSDTTRKQGDNLVSNQQQRVDEINEINKRYKDAKKVLQDAESKGESKEKIAEAAESLAAVQNELLDYLGLNPENGIVVRRDVDDSLATVDDFTSEVTPEQYVEAMAAAMAAQEVSGNRVNLQVTPVTLEEAKEIVEEGGKLFMSKDGMAGAYVKTNGYMGGLFKHPDSKLKGVSKPLQDLRSKEGGTYFDAYATKLEDIYVANGFKPIARVPFNEEFAPEGWDAPDSPLRNKPDVVFFVKGEGKVGDGKMFDNYTEAENYTAAEAAKNAEANKKAKVDEASGEVNSTTIKADENGNFTVPKDIPGMTAKSKKFFDTYLPLLEGMYPGIEIVITHDVDSVNALQKQLVEKGVPQAEEFSSMGGFWVQEGSTGTIYINPTTVEFNASLEGQGANAFGRTKSLEETVLEETFHALIGKTINSMTETKQAKLLDDLKKIIKNDPDLLARVEAKEKAYRDGNTEAIVTEEAIIEILSAVVADPSSVNMTVIAKIRLLINKIMSSLGKEFTIDSDASAIKILHALNIGADARVEADAKSKAQTRASKRVSPYALKEDGPITVKYNKTIYKYSKGVRKDIGSEPVEKTFNGKWHFINWWKQSTSMGKNTKVFGFEVDGKTVDVESLYNTRASSRLGASSGKATEIIDRHNNRIQEAIEQGVITEREANNLNKDWVGRPTNVAKYYERIPTEEMAADPDLQRIYDQKIDLLSRLEEKTIERIQYKAKSRGKKFYYGPDDVSTRASKYMRNAFIDRNPKAYAIFKANYVDQLCGLGGGKTCSLSEGTIMRAYFSQVAREIYNINPDDLNLAKRRDRGEGPTALTDAEEKRLKKAERDLAELTSLEIESMLKMSEAELAEFSGFDPTKFHENHDKGVENYFNSLLEDNVYRTSIGFRISKEEALKRLTEIKPIYNYLLSITSNGSKALSNNGVTMDLFAKIARDHIEGRRDPKKDGFISKTILDFIKKQDEFNIKRPIDSAYSGTRGDRTETIFNQIKKLNDVLKKYTSEKGILDGADLIEQMGETSKQKKYNNSQDLFGAKIGNYALNLNGNLNVLTQDSHVLYHMASMKGHYVDPSQLITGTTLAELKAKLESWGVDTKGIDIDTEQGMDSLFDALVELKKNKGHEHQNKAKTLYKKIAGFLPPNDSKWSREQNERAINGAIKLLKEKYPNRKLSRAQVGQMLYASGRMVFHKDYTPNDKMVTELLEKGENNERKYLKFSLEEETTPLRALADWMARVPEQIRTMTSRLTQEAEETLANTKSDSRASKRLSPNKSDATDSPLYRVRDYKEALNFRGKMLTEDAENQALTTDKVSRKIMEKNNEVNLGDRVGIRLNLNVLQNTGVPVQAIHEITSTGNVKNVLKYGTVVTIKNPTLHVNQKGREKIATFQENKFPMASVNGEFVSSKIEDANFDGVKAIFNPHQSNVFTDVAGRPIKLVDGEATVVGSQVFLRGEIEYYDFNDPIVMQGREESVESKEKRVKRGKDYNASLKKFEVYMGKSEITYESRAELEAAYDNMSLKSKIALDKSEYANNLNDLDIVTRASKRMRNTAGRAARTYTGARKQILDNPSNYINAQNLAREKDRLKEMSIQDLVEIFTDDALGRLSLGNDDISVLAGAELLNRAYRDKDYDRAAAIIAELAATGTTVGRVMRHMRELKSSTPEGMAMIVKQEVAKRNKKLSKEQEERLNQMSQDLFQLHAEHEELMRRAIAGDDVEAELEAKTKEVKAKERELDTFTNAVIEKGWADILTQLIQGNLLTPMSQITNVGANMINAIGKIGVDAIALPIEKLVNLFGIESPMKRNYSLNAYLYGMRKFGAGFMEALDEIATGQSKDVTEWRVNRGFAPIRSFLAAMGKGEALPTDKDTGRVSLNQRMKLFVQGTLGVPAETMFRFLSLGDTPFRRGTEGIELYQMGRSKGLKGEALVRFMKYPDKRSREIAEREGRKLTFQERTGGSEVAEQSINFMQRMLGKGFDVIPGVNGEAVAKFLIRSSVPFVRTPANILMDTLTFVSPYVAGIRIMGDLKNNDARSAAQNFGKMMIGSMVTQTAMILIKEGLISGEVEWDEDEERNLAYDQFPPNSINISGLKRWFSGESTEKRADDNFVSYMKLGIPGTIIGAMVKGVDKDEVKARDYSGIGFIHHAAMDAFGAGPFSSISHMMDQSFLQGVNNFMEVLTSTDPDDFSTASERWLASTFKATSAIALPNTLSSLHRAERTYMPDMRITKDMSYGERLLKRVEYIVKDRTFGATDVPVRTNWKGEPIKQNPRGNMGWSYQLFDIAKIRKGEADVVSQEMYRIYEQTEAIPEVVGTPAYAAKRKVPVPNLTDRKAKKAIRRAGLQGFTFLKDQEFLDSGVYLNTKHINQMMKISGKDRYSKIEKLMSGRKYQNSSDYEKLDMLNELNDNYKSAIEYDRRGSLRPHSIQLLHIIEDIYKNDYEED